MVQQTTTEGRIIRVDGELIEILEKLRKRVRDYSYGALDENVSYEELTRLLAKKIKLRGGIV